MNILLIEDSAEMQVVLRNLLGHGGHTLLIASTGGQARKILRDKEVHLIILDLGLPDEDGLKFYGQIQENERLRNISVMVVSGKVDTHVKVAAFSLGVDDFIQKPFDPLELRARVEARLNKIKFNADRDSLIETHLFQLNLPKQKAFVRDGDSMTELELTSLEFKLLYELVRHEDQILSRDQLLDSVWGNATEILDRTVDVHVSLLRRKLGCHGPLLQAVRGEGYRLCSPTLRKASA